jgi:hypothetical protein
MPAAGLRPSESLARREALYRTLGQSIQPPHSRIHRTVMRHENGDAAFQIREAGCILSGEDGFEWRCHGNLH